MSSRTMGSISKKPSHSKMTQNSDDAFLKASVFDTIRICEQRSILRFIGFLDEHQRQFIQSLLAYEKHNYLFYGGFPEAERTFLGVFPDGELPQDEEFPIMALAFQYRKGISLCHRDFLGTMLSFGVKREKIGDILCSDGLAVAFIDLDIARFLAGQITKVGGEGVKVIPDYKGELPAAHTFKNILDTIATPRLDAVVKIAAGISREEASHRIEAGQVSVNHIPCIAVAKNIVEGDILSIRGSGRYRIEKLGPITRKGRLFITIKKYL